MLKVVLENFEQALLGFNCFCMTRDLDDRKVLRNGLSQFLPIDDKIHRHLLIRLHRHKQRADGYG